MLCEISTITVWCCCQSSKINLIICFFIFVTNFIFVTFPDFSLQMKFSFKMNFFFGQGKKIVCFRLTGCQKKKHSPGRSQFFFFFFAYFFRNIVALFYPFFYLDSIHVYLEWFISIKTSSWYICSIFKTRDNFFQYTLIGKFITIKDNETKYRYW